MGATKFAGIDPTFQIDEKQPPHESATEEKMMKEEKNKKMNG
jgi:hypothetical protein